MTVVKAADIDEAVAMAEGLKRSGTHDWFRGQTRNWPVKSSFARLDENARAAALAQIGRFEQWVKNTPGLEHLAEHPDAIIAVAQHYELPTNFVDFTMEPRIAGFFASSSGGDRDQYACIICVSTADVEAFWKLLPEKYPRPEFLTLPVPDLWRLETQQGRFLYCPYDNVERIYGFDRILFPPGASPAGMHRDEIYPPRKSALEILLDQYFMNEHMLESQREIERLAADVHVLEFATPPGGCDPEIFPRGLHEHPSWSGAALNVWLNTGVESFFGARSPLRFELALDTFAGPAQLAVRVRERIRKELMPVPGARDKLVGWQVTLPGNGTLPQDFPSSLAERLARLWDGLRRLPYPDDDIAAGIGMCAAFAVALDGAFGSGDSGHMHAAARLCLPDAVELEFGAADGSYARSYASQKRLLSAMRSDLAGHMAPEWQGRIGNNVRAIFQASWDPRKTFDFDKLAPLFAREIAPLQVLLRDEAVFYSPARLTSLGLP